ncbi:hypothetical protein ATANTOWER_028529, partial [Ataeniobius toweri]|nr:hypothetical protein [Ataeniobius toweri]
LSLRKDELKHCQRERDEAVLREQTLEKKVHDLELEAEKNTRVKDDKTRQMKLMEERIAQLELDLSEERQSGDQLMDRIDRGREQVCKHSHTPSSYSHYHCSPVSVTHCPSSHKRVSVPSLTINDPLLLCLPLLTS